jgi:hypothetical protein
VQGKTALDDLVSICTNLSSIKGLTSMFGLMDGDTRANDRTENENLLGLMAEKKSPRGGVVCWKVKGT